MLQVIAICFFISLLTPWLTSHRVYFSMLWVRLHFYVSYSAPDFGFSVSQNASTFPSLPQSLVCLDTTSNDPIIVMCMCVYVSTYKHSHLHVFTGTGSVLEHGHRFHFHFSPSLQKPQIESFYFQNKKISELRVISPFSWAVLSQ